MMQLITPRMFLLIGGIALVALGVLGYFGPIGPTPNASIFGSAWYFDNYENVVHFILGVVALAAFFWLPGNLQKPLALIVGIVALLFAVYSGVVSSNFLGASLENPADTILHLVVGAWGVWAGLRKSMGMAHAA